VDCINRKLCCIFTDDLLKEKKPFKHRSRLDIRKFVFSNRIVDRWNSLSVNCVMCTTVNQFKTCIASQLELET